MSFQRAGDVSIGIERGTKNRRGDVYVWGRLRLYVADLAEAREAVARLRAEALEDGADVAYRIVATQVVVEVVE